MIFKEQRFISNDNEELLIRSPRGEDAEEMMRYIMAMCDETEFVGRYPEEVTETIEEEKQLLEDIAKSNDSIQISAFSGDRIIGNASIFPYSKRLKIKHRADFGIAVLKPYWSKGIGRMLTNACIEMAESMGYTMVELTALSTNNAGISLYESVGFERWGLLHDGSCLKSGMSVDEVYMVKYL